MVVWASLSIVPRWLFGCGEGNGFLEDGLEVAILCYGLELHVMGVVYLRLGMEFGSVGSFFSFLFGEYGGELWDGDFVSGFRRVLAIV